MTRRDYVRIAAALADARQRVARLTGTSLATGQSVTVTANLALQIATEALADALAADNPRFDPDRFYDAASAEAVQR